MQDAPHAQTARRYFHLDCFIEKQREFAPGHFVISLRCPEYGGGFLPGQFVNLKCDDTPYGRLYRPFSVLEYGAEARTMHIYYHAIGSGTIWLAARKPGDALKVLLPLGNSFSVPHGAKRAALVAGGVGVAPLIFLARFLAAARQELKIDFLMGARNKDSLCIPLIDEAGIEAAFATDDGSFGRSGLVTEMLEDLLSGGGVKAQKPDYIACCGPTPMMNAVQRVAAKFGVNGEASLEERMACGIGACFGCVATLENGNGTISRVTTCRNGPVLPLERVKF